MDTVRERLMGVVGSGETAKGGRDGRFCHTDDNGRGLVFHRSLGQVMYPKGPRRSVDSMVGSDSL